MILSLPCSLSLSIPFPFAVYPLYDFVGWVCLRRTAPTRAANTHEKLFLSRASAGPQQRLHPDGIADRDGDHCHSHADCHPYRRQPEEKGKRDVGPEVGADHYFGPEHVRVQLSDLRLFLFADRAGPRPEVGAPSATAAQLIQPDLASGFKSGYIFNISNCSKVNAGGSDRITGYNITATPQTVGSTGDRAFCSDQSGIIKFDPQGGTNCSQTLGQ